MPVEQQLSAVAGKLRELNPRFDGNVGPRYENGRLVEIHLLTDFVTQIGPVAALQSLEILVCRGSAPGRGRLADLSPLKSLKSLTYLDCSANPVRNLRPLRGLSLRQLICWATPVADLEPLRDLPLELLDLNQTMVSDLDPLAEMPLRRLFVQAPYVKSLEVVRRLKLTSLKCLFRPERHARVLRDAHSLLTINDESADDFWSAYDRRLASLEPWIQETARLPADQQIARVSARLRELNPEFDGKLFPTIEEGQVRRLLIFTDNVTDIAPVRALTALTHLMVRGSVPNERAALFDLDPVRHMSLEYLECGGTSVADLSPLAGSTIRAVSCWGTWVRDLTPLKSAPVFFLDCRNSQVTNLAHLAGSGVRRLDVTGCAIEDYSVLERTVVFVLRADINTPRDAAALRANARLEEINGQTAAEFWKTFARQGDHQPGLP